MGRTPPNRRTTIRLGCIPELPLQRLLSFLGALYEQEPGLQADVEHLHAADQVRRLHHGEIDLGIVHGANDDALEAETVFPGEPLTVFLPIGHDLGSQPAVTLDNLAPEPLLVPPQATDPVLHDWLVSLAGRNGYGLGKVRETGTGHARDVLLAVADGRGFALGPRSTLRAVGEMDTVLVGRPLEPAVLLPDTVAVWRANPPPEQGAVVAAVRAATRRLRPL
jgi:LysR family transcriptional regulator, benzoate and cis,cis-muconate-responsive activator of ben and cat genes